MPKSFLFNLFGWGKMPAALKAEIEREGLVLFDEGVAGSQTMRNFHQPGTDSSWQKWFFVGSVAISQRRVLALKGRRFLVDVPLTDSRLGRMRFEQENETTLLMAFEASLSHPDWSGQIEYRFHTDQAAAFANMLMQTALALGA